MLQGKYGVGLLGFWSIGAYFEMRSQVNDSEAWVLRLTEDEPRFQIERLRGRLPLRGTWTEMVVRQLRFAMRRSACRQVARWKVRCQVDRRSACGSFSIATQPAEGAVLGDEDGTTGGALHLVEDRAGGITESHGRRYSMN